MPTQAENAEMVARMLCQPLRRWTGFIIRLHCQSCREERDIKVQSLIERHGDKAVAEVIDRFKCSVCRTAPVRIEVRHHVAVWTVRGDILPGG